MVNHTNIMVPRMAADSEMPIQKPFRPKYCPSVQHRNGRSRLEVMLEMLGGSVLPMPRKVPPQVPSSAMKGWHAARISRYSAPICTSSGGSLRNSENRYRPANASSSMANVSQISIAAMEMR